MGAPELTISRNRPSKPSAAGVAPLSSGPRTGARDFVCIAKDVANQAARSACTVDGLLSAAKTKRYPLARLRRMALAAYLQLPPAPAQVPYIRVLAATAAGRAHLRRLRDAGAPVLTKPADVSSLGADAAALFALEGRCTDLYVLARPDLTQSAPGQDYRTTPVMI